LAVSEGFDLLDAQVKMVTVPHAPIPFSPILEQTALPNTERIIKAAKEIV
jgi:pyruvate dehydrogenase E1 component beta subunit